jgi:hypothetical protein
MTDAQVDLQTGPVARRRPDGRDVPEIVDRELAERLVAQAREAGWIWSARTGCCGR